MATRRLYRAGEGRAEVFGVCQGIADWKDLPVSPIRWIVVILAFCTFSVVAIAYLILAIVVPVNPADKGVHATSTVYEEDEEDERLRREYERLKKKVEDLESEAFDKERSWDDRFYGDQK